MQRPRDPRLLNLLNKFGVLQNLDKSEGMTRKKETEHLARIQQFENSARVESSTAVMATKRKGIRRREIASHKTI